MKVDATKRLSLGVGSDDRMRDRPVVASGELMLR